MELLLEIRDKEILDENTLKFREAARAVVFDKDNLIPILFVSKFDYYKLPGGGIDEGEEKLTALNREMLEEIGSTIEVTGEIGEITEYRSEFNLKQISYCYLGKVITKGQPNFTDEEKNKGFQIIWLPIDEAMEKIRGEKPQNHTEAVFIQKRDLVFLQKAKEIIERPQ